MNLSGSAVPSALGLRRGLTAFGSVLAVVAGPALTAPAQADAVPQQQALVVLLRDHVARARPSADSPAMAVVSGRRPLTNVRTVLPELERTRGRDGRIWVRVALPGRPNGSRGWIRAAHARPASTPWRIVVSLGARRVTAYRYGDAVRRFRAVVGAPSTPTPRGRFFVEEALALDAGAAGAPFALATSARSHVYQEFDGGPGQIALHGRGGLPGALGTASSHGCVRLTTRSITWLVRRIGAGVPVTIRR